MTIEEKTKAYDEVREKIAIRFGSNVADEIFSQFEMSEDEKIRKWLIRTLKALNTAGVDIDGAYEMMLPSIDWLEKQQKPVIEMKTPEESLGIDSNTYNKIVDECIYGEQNTADKVEPKFKIGDWVVYDHRPYQVVELPKEGCINLGLRGNEKIEFAPSSYCRPWTVQDAKAGDVLTCYSEAKGKPIEQTGIVKQYVGRHGGCSNCFEAFFGVDWDGKVVIDGFMGSTNIFPSTEEQRDTLMKAMDDAGYVFDFEKKELKKIEQKPVDKVEPKFNIGDKIIGIISGMQYYITKVCDDHYYTESGCIIMFCAQNNFELVEQNPAWSEDRSKELSLSLQIQAYLNTASDELYAKGKSLYSEKRLEDIHKCMLMWQKLHNAYFYQKPAEWSKKDEEYAENLCNFIDSYGSKYWGETTQGWYKYWLKSLKERVGCGVNCTTKKEWSEEDNDNLTNILVAIDNMHESSTAKELKCWLKSLRPQPKREWDDRDKRIYSIIENILMVAVQDGKPTEDSLYREEIIHWFKSLRPQKNEYHEGFKAGFEKAKRMGNKHWKPTEEQMEALESATENCAYSEYQDCLRELIGQLKKLREE